MRTFRLGTVVLVAVVAFLLGGLVSGVHREDVAEAAMVAFSAYPLGNGNLWVLDTASGTANLYTPGPVKQFQKKP